MHAGKRSVVADVQVCVDVHARESVAKTCAKTGIVQRESTVLDPFRIGKAQYAHCVPVTTSATAPLGLSVDTLSGHTKFSTLMAHGRTCLGVVIGDPHDGICYVVHSGVVQPIR